MSKERDHDRVDAVPTTVPQTLRNLLGLQVQVATEGGNIWLGQVAAIVGNLLVLSGVTLRYIDINDITAIDVVPAVPPANGVPPVTTGA
ncbi:MAG: hypothetical protein ACOY93_00875 [Bacillota bacterium]